MSIQTPINTYRCDACAQEVVTVDREEGVTPSMIVCRITEGCIGAMHSSFYQADQSLQPTYEWRKPTGIEYRRLNAGMRRHVDKGGMLLFRIGEQSLRREHPPRPKPEPKSRGNRAKRRREAGRINARALEATARKEPV